MAALVVLAILLSAGPAHAQPTSIDTDSHVVYDGYQLTGYSRTVDFAGEFDVKVESRLYDPDYALMFSNSDFTYGEYTTKWAQADVNGYPPELDAWYSVEGYHWYWEGYRCGCWEELLPHTADFAYAQSPPPPPPPLTVEININDTSSDEDDITVLSPAQTISAQVIAHNASGTIQLTVPSGKASINQTTLNLTNGVPAYVTITPSQRSNSVRDVQIVATSNGSQVGQASLTIVDVSFPQHIRHDDTPQEMPDRIPPRIDTPVQVTVQPSLSGSNQKVTLAPLNINSTNGMFTIGGGSTHDIVQTEVVNLMGTFQTAATYVGDGGGNAGNLKIAARVRGQTAVESNGFSVAAIMGWYYTAFIGPVTNAGWVGMYVTVGFWADSGVMSDLNAVMQREEVQVASPGGTGVFQNISLQTSNWIWATMVGDDEHSVTTSALNAPGGQFTANQTHVFWDRRTGAKRVPAATSGYQVPFVSAQDSRSIFDLTVRKYGSSVTANGVYSDAGYTDHPPDGLRCQSDGVGDCQPWNYF
jgi:hypothetical protein